MKSIFPAIQIVNSVYQEHSNRKANASSVKSNARPVIVHKTVSHVLKAFINKRETV